MIAFRCGKKGDGRQQEEWLRLPRTGGGKVQHPGTIGVAKLVMVMINALLQAKRIANNAQLISIFLGLVDVSVCVYFFFMLAAFSILFPPSVFVFCIRSLLGYLCTFPSRDGVEPSDELFLDFFQ